MRDEDAGGVGALGTGDDLAAGECGPDQSSGLRAAVPGDGGRPLRPGEPRAAGDLRATGGTDADPRAVPGGRERASGAGSADGDAFGAPGGGDGALGFRFRETPPPGGYLWWYVDGLSADGSCGVTLIAFVGSVFSPYYFWRGRQDPRNHISLNVALYGPGWFRWAMTERSRARLVERDHGVDIGPSALHWTGEALEVDIDETSVPHLSRLRGKVTVRPRAVMEEVYTLDAPGRHWWRPVAPAADIEVALERPAFQWRGAGYFDMNWGAEPIEAAFQRWNWSRAPTRTGGATVLYDATRRDGSDLSLALRFDGTGGVECVDAPPHAALPKTLWRVARRTQADAGAEPSVHRSYEDSPFYARAELRTRLFGEDVAAMHETLDLDRFQQRWVKSLLPWRMPRAQI